jgi:hypothetical protein
MTELLISLGRTLGFSLTSGVNLYATVAILGLAARYDWVDLPEQYEVFASEWIIGAAIVLYVVEFVADKIPWVDSLWDSVHTFVRPVGGALIAAASIGEAPPVVEALVGLMGGTIAAGSHLAKASTRVAANTSPEPFSNWALSFAEDVFVVALGVLALQYPLIALAVTVAILVTIVMALRWILGKLRRAAAPPVPSV